jgi:aminopeptidase
MPTEEVFTTPDRLRVDGIVYSVIPLVHAGSIIRDFWIRFENGCAVEFGAEEGEEVLRQIIETDENSCRLGECALVAKDTPIRESGLLFYNTLYDENASCHLALGQGFPGCREGGLEMEKAELIEHGVNFSHTHVDFMIGANDMNIVGVKSDGEEIPIFEDGVWAPYFC